MGGLESLTYYYWMRVAIQLVFDGLHNNYDSNCVGGSEIVATVAAQRVLKFVDKLSNQAVIAIQWIALVFDFVHTE